MPYFDHNGANLYYEVDGSGSQTIFFAHGFMLNTQMFEFMVDHFYERFTCVSLDFRGQGLSDYPSKGYDMNSLTEDVAALITHLNLGQVHFVGFSMGGFIGQRLAIQYPEKVKSLTLINTSCDVEQDASKKQFKWINLYIRVFGVSAIVDRSMKLLFSEEFLEDEENEDIIFIMKNRLLSNNKKGLLRLMKGILNRDDIREQLPLLRKPTLVISADKDVSMSVDQGRELHESIIGSEFHIIENCGHNSPIEKPDELNTILDAFLSRQS